jgi:hypothetical protein
MANLSIVLERMRQGGARGLECRSLGALNRELQGAIDHLNRPYVRLDLVGFADPVVAFIDTGFNGAVILNENQAARMGFAVDQTQVADPLLANQQVGHFYFARGDLVWFDEITAVTAYVPVESAAERVGRLKKENEEVWIGTELLLGCRLEIDFVGRTVVVARAV